MRLHNLSVTAFGPFADRQQVDFDALADGGLFLFHGPTGAGKTSILDAVCFALYGQVPGARAQAGALHSDHAAPGVGPQVTLELTVRGRRLLISRSPQWQRPKRRGTGTTTEQARVLVQERDGESWRAVSTRLDEAGQLLGRLIGLSMAQFCQVVLLPQGQFAEFLRADADRRRDLLASLFDTGRFAAVEAWLVDRRRDATRALAEHDERIQHVLARVAEAVDLPGMPEEDAAPGGDGVTAAPDAEGVRRATCWVSALTATARVDMPSTVSAERTAAARRDSARISLGQAERLAAAQARVVALRAREADLNAAAPAALAVVTELDGARRAAPVAPLVAVTARLEEALATAIGQAETCTFALRPALPDLFDLSRPDRLGPDPLPAERLPTLVRHVGDVRAEISRLGHLAADESEASQLTDVISGLEREVVALDAQTRDLNRWFDTAQRARERLEQRVQAARTAFVALPGAVGARESAERRLASARRRDELDRVLPDLQDQLRQQVDAAQQAKERWLDLRARRLGGMAAELAAGLVDGDGCPVCGSDLHPAPAAARDDAVSQDAEAAAQAAVEAADRLRGDAERAALAADAERRSEVAALGAELSTESAIAARAAAQAKHAALLVSAGGLPAAEAQLADYFTEADRRAESRLKLASDAERLRERTASSHRRLSELATRLGAARGDDPTIQARAVRLTRLADDGESLVGALTEAGRLRAELETAVTQAEQAAVTGGLPGLDGVRGLVRDESRIDELDALRSRRQSEAATVDEMLGDPELVDAGTAEPADVAAHRRELADAEAEHEAALGARDRARGRLRALARLDAALDELVAQRLPLAQAHRLVDHLSRLAEGKSADNRLRMSLSAYVLAARLEQVAVAASARLTRMSSGRYTLVHTAEAGRGRGRGGLHLRVLDAWTGAERDPATLSGGESFAASLALALGLADVVTAEAGGSLLETLFVDEGFGGLDEDTLDEVMGVLDELREGGRVVGIVSHVADLRARIPAQLRVVKGRAGSVVLQ